MIDFSPVRPAIGGILLGLSATMFLYFNGRILGISGIAGGLVDRDPGERNFRVTFLAGLVVGAVLLLAIEKTAFGGASASLKTLAIAGLLVGFGTRLANGCTSGHGVCGLSRFSMRSLIATITFMAAAALTVFVVRHGIGGAR